MRRTRLVLAGIVAAAAMAAGVASAQPGWGAGVQFGWGPPHHRPYPTPYHYAPHHYAPHRYVPPPAPVAGEGCYAGPYVCPLEGPARVGMPCSCPTAQGHVWGRAR